MVIFNFILFLSCSTNFSAFEYLNVFYENSCWNIWQCMMLWTNFSRIQCEMLTALHISLFCFSGRVRYKFASFWNRNHTLRILQRATKNFRAMLEAEKQVFLIEIGPVFCLSMIIRLLFCIPSIGTLH